MPMLKTSSDVHCQDGYNSGTFNHAYNYEKNTQLGIAP